MRVVAKQVIQQVVCALVHVAKQVLSPLVYVMVDVTKREGEGVQYSEDGKDEADITSEQEYVRLVNTQQPESNREGHTKSNKP